jgi:predicted NBD/HSP70 family sugar kinase
MTLKNGIETKPVGVVSAKPQTVRQLNRATVLELIRQYQPVSRASLARYAGIHRSNIAIIVSDLQKEGLLREERCKQTMRGRTPTLISLDRGSVSVLAVNLRRARSTVALVSLDGHVESTYSFQTPEWPDAFVEELVTAVASMTSELGVSKTPSSQIAQMVVSIPGILDLKTTKRCTIWTPGLENYSGTNLAKALREKLGVPCLLANNASLGAIAVLRAAEAKKKQVEDFVLLMIGDIGVGSGVVIQRKLYSGYNETYAGEVGHMVIDPKGPQCGCGRRGCWQLYICDRATWARYNRKVEYTAARFEEFLSAVEANSPKALSALRETAAYLSLGISNIALTLNPEKIVLGGALARVWPFLQKELKSAFFLPHHHAMIEAIDVPVDALFMKGAVQRAIDLILTK